jgi:hypothetical protein
MSGVLTPEEVGDREIVGVLKLNFNKSLFNLISPFFVSKLFFYKEQKE